MINRGIGGYRGERMNHHKKKLLSLVLLIVIVIMVIGVKFIWDQQYGKRFGDVKNQTQYNQTIEENPEIDYLIITNTKQIDEIGKYLSNDIFSNISCIIIADELEGITANQLQLINLFVEEGGGLILNPLCKEFTKKYFNEWFEQGNKVAKGEIKIENENLKWYLNRKIDRWITEVCELKPKNTIVPLLSTRGKIIAAYGEKKMGKIVWLPCKIKDKKELSQNPLIRYSIVINALNWFDYNNYYDNLNDGFIERDKEYYYWLAPHEKFTFNSYLEHSEIYGKDRECEKVFMSEDRTLQITSMRGEITLDGYENQYYNIKGTEGEIRITVRNDSDSYVYGCVLTTKLKTQKIIFDEGLKHDQFYKSHFTEKPIFSLNGSTKQYVKLRVILNENQEDATLLELNGERFEHTVELVPGANQLLVEATNRKGEVEQLYYNIFYYATPFKIEPIQETVEMVEKGVTERSVRLEFYINRFCEGWLNGEKMIDEKEGENRTKAGWVDLAPGENKVMIEVTDVLGNTINEEMTITYKP